MANAQLNADQQTGETSVLDQNRVSEMLDDFGAELFAELLETFKGELTETLNELVALGGDASLEQVRPLLHLIQGCAANLGAVSLGQLSSDLRSNGGGALAGNWITDLQNASAEAIHQLENRLRAVEA